MQRSLNPDIRALSLLATSCVVVIIIILSLESINAPKTVGLQLRTQFPVSDSVEALPSNVSLRGEINLPKLLRNAGMPGIERKLAHGRDPNIHCESGT